VRETSHRALAMRHFDVQLLGGLGLHLGRIVEMQTGEGKTLVVVLAAYLHALLGQGVHVLTFNDYLARRDACWMGPIYERLGVSVAYVQEGMTPEQRRRAYGAEVTYLTAKESGFDYLRDGLCTELAAACTDPLPWPSSTRPIRFSSTRRAFRSSSPPHRRGPKRRP